MHCWCVTSSRWWTRNNFFFLKSNSVTHAFTHAKSIFPLVLSKRHQPHVHRPTTKATQNTLHKIWKICCNNDEQWWQSQACFCFGPCQCFPGMLTQFSGFEGLDALHHFRSVLPVLYQDLVMWCRGWLNAGCFASCLAASYFGGASSVPVVSWK